MAEGGVAPANAFGSLYPPRDQTQRDLLQQIKSFAEAADENATLTIPLASSTFASPANLHLPPSSSEFASPANLFLPPSNSGFASPAKLHLPPTSHQNPFRHSPSPRTLHSHSPTAVSSRIHIPLTSRLPRPHLPPTLAPCALAPTSHPISLSPPSHFTPSLPHVSHPPARPRSEWLPQGVGSSVRSVAPAGREHNC